MGRVLTKEQRRLIIALRLKDYRICEIAREMRITKRTIYKWLKRFDRDGTIESGVKKKCKRATTAAQDAAIIKAHRENPLRSTKEDAKEFVISTQTVRRRLREAGLRNSRTPVDLLETESKESEHENEFQSLDVEIEVERVGTCIQPPFELVEVHYSEPDSGTETNRDG